jgi:hypothetical protein
MKKGGRSRPKSKEVRAANHARTFQTPCTRRANKKGGRSRPFNARTWGRAIGLCRRGLRRQAGNDVGQRFGDISVQPRLPTTRVRRGGITRRGQLRQATAPRSLTEQALGGRWRGCRELCRRDLRNADGQCERIEESFKVRVTVRRICRIPWCC